MPRRLYGTGANCFSSLGRSSNIPTMDGLWSGTFEGTKATRGLLPQVGLRRAVCSSRASRLSLSLPLLLVGSLLQSWWKSLLFHRDYGIRWYQLPALLFYAVIVHALEIPGM